MLLFRQFLLKLTEEKIGTLARYQQAVWPLVRFGSPANLPQSWPNRKKAGES
jgi:hypothetical protein